MQKRSWKRELPLHVMILPGFLFLLVFNYLPIGGIIIAFQKFIPAKGLFGDQDWIGLRNFEYVMNLPNFDNIMWNTFYIAMMKVILGLLVPIVIAILLNEVRHMALKRGVQTAIYLPHFLSWVVLGGIFIEILSPNDGLVNRALQSFGIEPIFFLGDNRWFPNTMILTDVWKEFGYGTIIYLAALTSINPNLYEAAQIDGASRWRQTLHVTLPGMQMVIVLLMVLNLGNLLNAGFDQIFNMYSPMVYESGDILDTFVYRIGLLDAQFGVATAVGLFKSVIALVLVSVSYYIAYKVADYRIF
ncbi:MULTISPECIES: ABC transporter permease [Bacillales]|uniref:ABC transporter permease n=1 Tax=Bacillales TaxID=1385 RepID=UPI0001B9EDD0|nr:MULTISPECIES: ABC transporter permease subunit [Paenibacillus]ACX65513.1 binding-protein-dependent transport systems inner membrane component [Paenibacillus sp. Y412MC10]MCM3257976.1 ABC transporter permease subunit [Paenibacillus lautus]PCL93161.1 sugar ABC transporter permease [Paenibacillus lautus]QOT12236.1 sugar ABC transporter permease [Paenibacillus sp. JNUCC-32]WFB55656.1 ABC transporter permease subunit [Paenibacillus sp. BR1-192]